MKQLWHMIERYYPWLLLLLGVDCFCAVILWISDIQVFQTLIGLVVLTSILLFSAILFVLNKRENTHMELFRDFLSDPTICNEERLLSAISQKEGESVRFLASVLREYKNESNNMADALRDYEEYVEGWAHEAKTPLSLLTMLLDNRNDEISPSLQAKLDYVRSQLQEDVTQMLYYARLKSSTKDYRFEDAWVKFWRTMPHFLKRSILSFSTNCNLKQSIQTVEDFSLCWDKSLAMPSNIAAIVPCLQFP